MSSPVPELLAGLDVFMQEQRRCGELDGGVDGDVVRMSCECGTYPVRSSGS